MKMNEIKVREAILALTEQHFKALLALLVHNLTVCIRANYPNVNNDPAAPNRIVALNETQHGVTQQLMTLLLGQPPRYAVAEFLDVLYADAAFRECEQELDWALRASLFSLLSKDRVGQTT